MRAEVYIAARIEPLKKEFVSFRNSTLQGGTASSTRPIPALATGIEILAVYAGILLYIWRWESTHPYAWVPLLAVVILSHVVYGDNLREMGLAGHEFKACVRLLIPLLIGVLVAGVIYGLWRREWTVPHFGHAGLSLGGYTLWCAFQQYLMQSYFHRRLRRIMHTPYLSSLAVAVMFAGAHIPNPILMTATLVGGFVLAEVFVRHPNIWPLAMVQAVTGFLIGGLSPAAVIHHMRVGPGYYSYHLP